MSVSTVFNVPDTTAYGKIVIKESSESTSMVATSQYSEAVVREYFKDIPVMIQVARCESTFRHTLRDGTVLRGSVDKADTGVMQINKRYHEKAATVMGLDLENIHDNLAYARYLYEKQGTQPWSASSSCWGQTLAMNN